MLGEQFFYSLNREKPLEFLHCHVQEKCVNFVKIAIHTKDYEIRKRLDATWFLEKDKMPPSNCSVGKKFNSRFVTILILELKYMLLKKRNDFLVYLIFLLG